MTTEIYEYFLPSLPIHSGYCRTSRYQVFIKTLFWIFPKTHWKTHVLESLLINLHISSAYIFIEIETSAKEFSLEFYKVFRKLFCRTPLVGCILHSKIWKANHKENVWIYFAQTGIFQNFSLHHETEKLLTWQVKLQKQSSRGVL